MASIAWQIISTCIAIGKRTSSHSFERAAARTEAAKIESPNRAIHLFSANSFHPRQPVCAFADLRKYISETPLKIFLAPLTGAARTVTNNSIAGGLAQLI